MDIVLKHVDKSFCRFVLSKMNISDVWEALRVKFSMNLVTEQDKMLRRLETLNLRNNNLLLKQLVDKFQELCDTYLMLGGTINEHKICTKFFNMLPENATFTLWKNLMSEEA